MARSSHAASSTVRPSQPNGRIPSGLQRRCQVSAASSCRWLALRRLPSQRGATPLRQVHDALEHLNYDAFAASAFGDVMRKRKQPRRDAGNSDQPSSAIWSMAASNSSTGIDSFFRFSIRNRSHSARAHLRCCDLRCPRYDQGKLAEARVGCLPRHRTR